MEVLHTTIATVSSFHVKRRLGSCCPQISPRRKIRKFKDGMDNAWVQISNDLGQGTRGRCWWYSWVDLELGRPSGPFSQTHPCNYQGSWCPSLFPQLHSLSLPLSVLSVSCPKGGMTLMYYTMSLNIQYIYVLVERYIWTDHTYDHDRRRSGLRSYQTSWDY